LGVTHYSSSPGWPASQLALGETMPGSSHKCHSPFPSFASHESANHELVGLQLCKIMSDKTRRDGLRVLAVDGVSLCHFFMRTGSCPHEV